MTCVRGCGTRVAGGIYACCGLSPDGRPIEDFLLDPPIALPDGLDIAPQGVMLLPRKKIHNVVDWVGSNFYPNVADFVEEVKALGMSRRLPSSIDFSLIKPGARHVVIHAKAIVAHPAMYRAEIKSIMTEGAHHCPKGMESHQRGVEVGFEQDQAPMCAGIWWEDLDGGLPIGDAMMKNERMVRRTMPWGRYDGRRRPDAALPEYIPAFFAAFPIVTLEVIRDPDDGKHEAAVEKAKKAGLDVELMHE